LADPYAERLARVRQRFVSALESKIEDTYASIPDLSGDTSAVIETVGETNRRMHGIVGIVRPSAFLAPGARHAASRTSCCCRTKRRGD
jgi:hypothetical protein